MPPPVCQIQINPAIVKQAIVGCSQIAVDTETTGGPAVTAELVGIAIYGVGQHVGYYIPIYSIVEPSSMMAPLGTVVQMLAFLLAGAGRTFVFHNAIYDLLVLRKYGVLCCGRIHDTLYGEHRLDNTYPSLWKHYERQNYKLKTLTRRFFGENQTTYDEVTQGRPMQMVPVAEAAPYAVQDVYYTAQHFLRQSAQLADPANGGINHILQNYDFPMLPIITEMLFHGIAVDVPLANQQVAVHRTRFAKVSRVAAAIAGVQRDFSKPGQLRWVLQKLGVPVTSFTSLSEKNLRLITAGGDHRSQRFVRAVIRRRNLASTISKFLVPLLRRTHANHRLYVGSFHSLNETGRYAASDPNIQALPDAGDSPVRQIITADAGHTVVSADFKNIEPRCLAQALLMFIAGQGADLARIKAENRDRAESLFGEILAERQFTRPYNPPAQLSYPAQSQLANFFLQSAGLDPYRLIAQQAFGIANPTKPERDMMKTIVLGVIYGKGLPALRFDLKLNESQTAQALNQFAAFMPELGVPTFTYVRGNWTRATPTYRTYKDEICEMICHSGEVTSLFGRKRRFAGLYHLRQCTRCRVYTYEGHREYEWDVAPVQLWNYTLHSFVYHVRDLKTGQTIATTNHRMGWPIVHKHGLTRWPFQQISYRTIRRIEVGPDLVHFTPIEDCQRQGFNALIQATAGDVFKAAIIRVAPVMAAFHARMITNIHDELVFSVPTGVLQPFVIALRAAMTQPPAPWWQIPIEVDVEVGPSFGRLAAY